MGASTSLPIPNEDYEKNIRVLSEDLDVKVGHVLQTASNPQSLSVIAWPYTENGRESSSGNQVREFQPTERDPVIVQVVPLNGGSAFGFYDTGDTDEPEISVEEYLEEACGWSGVLKNKPSVARRVSERDGTRKGSVIDDLDSDHPVVARLAELLLVLYGDARIEQIRQRPHRLVADPDDDRHPAPECASLLPIRCVCRSDDYAYIVFNLSSDSRSLEDYVKYGINELLVDDATTRFVMYQILAAVGSLHDVGLVHGNLEPTNIVLSDLMWVSLAGVRATKQLISTSVHPQSDIHFDAEQWQSAITTRWANGELSNYDYLLSLNVRAGRRVNDDSCHAIMPWVTNFRGDIRDLKKSKYRLNKGDELLDLAYEHGDNSCHINEVLSDVSLFTYTARRRPIRELQAHVRAHFEPNEYPANIQRLYEVSPEECIPQYYTDPSVFHSRHAEMPDLTFGDFARSAEEFVEKHAALLESDEVSENLHHWIDLVFGYLLSGPDAVAAKNVTRCTNVPSLSSSRANVPGGGQKNGFVQLFRHPHPKRIPPPVRHRSTQRADLDNSLGIPVLHEHFHSVDTFYRAGSGGLMTSPARVRPSPSFDDLASMVTATSLSSMTTARTEESASAAHPTTPSKKLDQKAPPSGSKRQKLRNMFLKDKGESKDLTLVEKLDGHSTNIDSLLLALPAPPITLTNEPTEFTSSLNTLESLTSFVHEYGDGPLYHLPVAPSDVSRLNFQFASRKRADLFALGTIFGEMYTGKPLFSSLSFTAQQCGTTPSTLGDLPTPVRSLLSSLVAPRISERIHTKSLLRSPFFPSYFDDLYSFLAAFNSLPTWNERLQLTFEHLTQLLALPIDGFVLLLPYFLRFFEEDDTKLGCLRLLDTLGTKLGGPLSRDHLLRPLIKLFTETDRHDIQEVLCSATLLRGVARMFGLSAFLDHVLPRVRSALTAKNDKVAKAACSSLIQLAPVFGPPVAVKFVATPLLKQLLAGVIVDATMVVRVITELGKQLGEPVVDSHFLPSIVEQLHSNHRQYRESTASATSKQRNSLMGAFALIEQLLDILSPTVILRALLIESCFLFDMLLYPFPDHFVFQRLVAVIVRVGKRVGNDNLEKHIVPHIDQFFVNYNHYAKHSPANTSPSQLGGDLYSKRAVCSVYIQFRDFLGPARMAELMPASVVFDNIVQFPEFEDWDADEQTTGTLEAPLTSAIVQDQMTGRSRSSSVSWLLSSNFQSTDFQREDLSAWKFEGAVLRAFRAHSSVVKALDVHTDEKCFVSSGKDGTVKCWHLDQEETQMTYTQHREPVFGVRYVNHGRHVASCDHTIHVWDPETGSALFQFQGQQDFTCFEHSEEQHALVAGSPELSLRFVDLHNGQQVSEWKLPVLQSNIRIGDLSLLPQVTLKSLALQSNGPYLAAGFSSGQVSLLDQRTGVVVTSFKAHEKEIMSVKFHGSGQLLTSSSDKSISVWDIRRDMPVVEHTYTGFSEGTNSFAIHRECIIAGAGKKIGIAAMPNAETAEASAKSKLSTKKLRLPSGAKGAISTLSVLDRTQLIILGFEDGHIAFCT